MMAELGRSNEPPPVNLAEARMHQLMKELIAGLKGLEGDDRIVEWAGNVARGMLTTIRFIQDKSLAISPETHTMLQAQADMIVGACVWDFDTMSARGQKIVERALMAMENENN